MWKDFTVLQDHLPRGIASPCFGGAIYRFEGTYPESSLDEIRHQLLYGIVGGDIVYTLPFTLNQAILQAKQYKMKLVVNLNEVIRENIPLVSPDTFGIIAGLVADILIMAGFTKETSAIGIINEPAERWHLDEDTYIQYVQYAHKYVKERLPLFIFNDEFHRFNEKKILVETTNIKEKYYAVHHLSSLDPDSSKAPENINWKNIEYAKTIANEYDVPIVCNEGGAWSHNYRSDAGNYINKRLIDECYKFGYVACSTAVLPDLNQAGQSCFSKLGYRIWSNDYSTLLTPETELRFWNDFEKHILKYKVEEIMKYLRPDAQQLFYEAMGWEEVPYHENTPSLPIVGRKEQNKAITWADFDAVFETLTKGIIHAMKDNYVLPESFPNPMDIKYNADGSWNNNWVEIAESNPEE